MKTKLLKSLLIAVLFSISLKDTFAQINLEQTYTGWASVTNLAVSGYKYNVLDVNTKTLKLYHPDHSLWKTINLSVPNGYTLQSSVYNVSENLFTLDGKVCFAYSYYTTNPSYTSESRVINENGTILLTIAGATYAYAYQVENEAKLLAYITNYTTGATTSKVYSLPGMLVTGVSSNKIETPTPYPNPADSYIIIPYSQEMIGNQGEISVYDISGNCLKTYQIDNTFDHLRIPTGFFASGIYIYKIRNSTSETGSGKFVVR